VNRLVIFSQLSEEYMELLKRLFEPFTCRAGTLVFEQGAAADYLYIVRSGTVAISFKPDDGTHITISHVEKDGLFGWSAVVGGDRYTSSATAIEDLESFRVRGSALRKLCAEHPEAGKDILESLANAVAARWKDAHKQVKSILAKGINGA
jgi:CRP-like cAMP-binding protein